MLRSLLLLSGLAALTSATASGPQATDGKRGDDEIMNPDPNDVRQAPTQSNTAHLTSKPTWHLSFLAPSSP